MKHDFEQKLNEREGENVRLKAKVKMMTMKTDKLEGEIAQVSRENEKLQSLCDELLNK